MLKREVVDVDWWWKIEKISKNTTQNSQQSPSESIHEDEA